MFQKAKENNKKYQLTHQKNKNGKNVKVKVIIKHKVVRFLLKKKKTLEHNKQASFGRIHLLRLVLLIQLNNPEEK